MHKNAGDLDIGDQFLMAGGLYKITAIYETNNDEMIRFGFFLNQAGRHHPQATMTLPRTMLFTTQ